MTIFHYVLIYVELIGQAGSETYMSVNTQFKYYTC